MSADQFRAWLEYASIEPFGEVQADLRAGTIARVMAEPNRDRSAHPTPFSILDFIPWIMTEERLAEREAASVDPESHRVYTEGEEWPEPSEAQRLAAERRAMILAGIDPDDDDDDVVSTTVGAEG